MILSSSKINLSLNDDLQQTKSTCPLMMIWKKLGLRLQSDWENLKVDLSYQHYMTTNYPAGIKYGR